MGVYEGDFVFGGFVGDVEDGDGFGVVGVFVVNVCGFR